MTDQWGDGFNPEDLEGFSVDDSIGLGSEDEAALWLPQMGEGSDDTGTEEASEVSSNEGAAHGLDVYITSALELSEAAMHRYDQTNDAVQTAIDQGILSPEYALPDIDDFFDNLGILTSSFEALERNVWEPNVFFVPHGLTSGQWNALLFGETDSPEGNVQYVATFPELGHGPRWSVVVMSDRLQPPLVDISANGQEGGDADLLDDSLMEFGTLDIEDDPEELIRNVSPTLIEYLAAQWSHVIDGRSLLDPNRTTTLLQERIESGDQTLVMRIGSHTPEDPTRKPFLYITLSSLESASPDDGIRPTARVEENSEET